MRHVFPLLSIFFVMLLGCDNSPPAPKASETAVLEKSEGVVKRLIDKLPSSVAQSEAQAREMAAQLQQRSYQLLAQGKFALKCDKQSTANAFEQAVCRQQARVGDAYLAEVRAVDNKRSGVTSSREQQANPWLWRVASETCWSADCNEAKHLREIAKTCGAPLPREASSQCLAVGEVW